MAPQARHGRVFRLCSEEEVGGCVEQLYRELERAFKREELERCMPKRLRATCRIYPGLCLVIGREDVAAPAPLPGFEPLYMGEIVGIEVEGSVYPSPWLFERLYTCTGRIRSAVEAEQQGVKAFLYGNDLLVASVRKIYGPFRKGQVVAVIDPLDSRVIGVARAAMDLREVERARSHGRTLDVVAENIFDLGWFLRRLKPAEEWE